MNRKQNTLILTGAGFSSPIMKYEDYSLNSTFLTKLLCDNGFMKNLYNDLYDSAPPTNFTSISELANKLLVDLQENHATENSSFDPNFEQIFFLIEYIINFSIGKKSNENSFILNTICDLKNQYSDYDISNADLYSFQEFMLDVISLFKASQEHLSLMSNYFLKILNDSYLQYYTLNYDSLIVDTLSNINDQHRDLEITKRFNLGCTYGASGGAIYAKDIFHTNPIFKDRKNSMFYLHGSVFYKDYLDTKIISFEERKLISPKSRNLMHIMGMPEPDTHLNTDGGFKFDQSFITGLNKNVKLTEEPYASIYAKFRIDLYNADKLIVFGYSFNDEHINAILSSNPPNLKKITVIDFISKDSNIRNNYFVFLNKVLSSLKPFGHNQKIELWNMVGLGDSRIEINRNRRYETNHPDYWEIEYDLNGTLEHLNRMTKN
jgi:SIR2-like domain